MELLPPGWTNEDSFPGAWEEHFQQDKSVQGEYLQTKSGLEARKEEGEEAVG